MNNNKKINRKEQILETLALLLELNPGVPITTAKLAQTINVSEATLYRHFPSKKRMFEALIEFAEETVFSAINKIVEKDEETITCCEKIVQMLLIFFARNPGITCILVGDALVGEDYKLRNRTMQFFDRLETHFKQILRESKLHNKPVLLGSVDASSQQMLCFVIGKAHQFIRTGFVKIPSDEYAQQWKILQRGIFVSSS